METSILINVTIIAISLDDGETAIRIISSGWKDHYNVVEENAIDEYDPTIECLTEEQIFAKYRIKNLKSLLKML